MIMRSHLGPWARRTWAAGWGWGPIWYRWMSTRLMPVGTAASVATSPWFHPPSTPQGKCTPTGERTRLQRESWKCWFFVCAPLAHGHIVLVTGPRDSAITLGADWGLLKALRGRHFASFVLRASHSISLFCHQRGNNRCLLFPYLPQKPSFAKPTPQPMTSEGWRGVLFEAHFGCSGTFQILCSLHPVIGHTAFLFFFMESVRSHKEIWPPYWSLSWLKSWFFIWG